MGNENEFLLNSAFHGREIQCEGLWIDDGFPPEEREKSPGNRFMQEYGNLCSISAC